MASGEAIAAPPEGRRLQVDSAVKARTGLPGLASAFRNLGADRIGASYRQVNRILQNGWGARPTVAARAAIELLGLSKLVPSASAAGHRRPNR